MPARYLVIGGGGFIGSHLCELLLERGKPVRVFEKPHLAKPAFAANPAVEWIEGDFCSRAEVSRAIEGCEVVFHLASTTLPKSSNEDPCYDVATNVVGSIAMFQEALRHRVRKVVFASSGGTVYGVPRRIPIDENEATDPISSYGITKLAIEKYLALFHRSAGLGYCVLRLANPFGPRQRLESAQGALTTFIHRGLAADPIEIWGDGSVVRDFLYITDAASALAAAGDWQGDAGVFNVGSGHGLSLNEVVSAIERALGRKLEVRRLPGRPFDVPKNVLDTSRIRRDLGWEPAVPLDEGIRRTVDFLLRPPGAGEP